MADIFQEETDSNENENTRNEGCLVSDNFLQMKKKSTVRYIPTDETSDFECGGSNDNAENEGKNCKSREIEIDLEYFFLDDLEELANSDYIHNRQLAAKKILDSLQKVGSNQEEYQSIISVMCKLSEDEESIVRSELVQHIPSIALYCQNHPDLKLVISQQLVPYTVKLLNDSISVRKLAQTALLVLLENNLIGQLQLAEWICPLVAQLVVCTNNHDELRIEDVTVMSLMIPLVDNNLTTKFFLDPYISLCSDKVLGIRTVCAMRFGTLCKITGTEITETSLLPAFLDLCKDVAWGVRKACANVFVEVANVVSLKTRKEVLSATLLKLLEDSSNSVRLAAYQSLGAFICSFADPDRTGFVCEDGKLNSVKVNDKKMKLNMNGPLSKDMDNKQFDHKVSSFFADQSTVLKENTAGDSSEVTSSLKPEKESGAVGVVSNIHILSSVTVATKDNSSCDKESAFNDFQYWREPLPDVEVNIFNSPAEMELQNSQEAASYMELFLEELQYPKVNYSDSKYNSLEDDTEALASSFKESALTFRTDDLSRKVTHHSDRFASIRLRKKNDNQNVPNDLFDNQDIVPNEILKKYFEALMSNSAMDNLLHAACAFSFPAVIYTLGKKYWPCLRVAFQRVTRNVQNFAELRNRIAIASSLPQLANMLGHDIIMKDLLPKFLEFLTDVDEVRQRVVLQIPDFLQHVPPEERYQFFAHIEDFLDDADRMKWRFRCCVAEQLSATLKLCNPYNIDLYFLPVALMLLQDKVFAVRLAAAEFMGNIVKNILDEMKMPLMLKLDASYRQAHKWNQRQTYVLVCEQLAKQRSLSLDTFLTEIVPRLFSLAWDVVPNVRLAVSRCIALTLLPFDYLPAIQKAHSDLFLQVYYSLQSDIDDDVRHYGLMCARAYSAPSYENKIIWSSECI